MVTARKLAVAVVLVLLHVANTPAVAGSAPSCDQGEARCTLTPESTRNRATSAPADQVSQGPRVTGIARQGGS